MNEPTMTPEQALRYEPTFDIYPENGWMVARWNELGIEASGENALKALEHAMQAGHEYLQGIRVAAALHTLGVK